VCAPAPRCRDALRMTSPLRSVSFANYMTPRFRLASFVVSSALALGCAASRQISDAASHRQDLERSVSSAKSPLDRWGALLSLISERTSLQGIDTVEAFNELDEESQQLVRSYYAVAGPLMHDLETEMDRADSRGLHATAATLAMVWVVMHRPHLDDTEAGPIESFVALAPNGTRRGQALHLVAKFTRQYPVVSWPQATSARSYYVPYWALGGPAAACNFTLYDPERWIAGAPADVPRLQAEAQSTVRRNDDFNVEREVWLGDEEMAQVNRAYEVANAPTLERVKQLSDELNGLTRCGEAPTQTLTSREYLTKQKDGSYDSAPLLRDATHERTTTTVIGGETHCASVDPTRASQIRAEIDGLTRSLPPRPTSSVKVNVKEQSNLFKGAVQVRLRFGEHTRVETLEVEMYQYGQETDYVAARGPAMIWSGVGNMRELFQPTWLDDVSDVTPQDRALELKLYRDSFETPHPLATSNGWDHSAAMRGLASVLGSGK